MLRAVIADDEKHICMLIRSLVDWAGLGMELSGEASDGNQAYDLIRRERPDVVITDIRMPGLDGLELIRKLRDEGICPSFILISGHKHFEYAHTAIQYGVENYLLKPINQEELTRNLISIRDKILEETSTLREQSQLRARLARSADMIHKEFMEKLLAGDSSIRDRSLEDLDEEYLLKLRPGRFVVALWKPDPKMPLDSAQMAVLVKRLESLVRRSLATSCFEILTLCVPGALACLLNYGDEGVLKNLGRELMEEARSMLYEFCYITTGLSRSRASLRELSPEEAFRSVRYRLALGYGRLIFAEDCDYPPTPLFDQDFADGLRQSLEVMDYGRIRKGLYRLRRDACRQEMNPCDLFSGMLALVDFLLEALAVLYRGDAPDFDRRAFVSRMEDAKTKTELFEQVQALYEAQMEAYERVSAARETRYVRGAKRYVAEHFAENITLEAIAEGLSLNPTYFSVLFKKQTGQNFSEYLLQYRMNKAKEYLAESGCSIAEIAGMVGYRDTKFFSKQFLKEVSIKPSEYRKLYS